MEETLAVLRAMAEETRLRILALAARDQLTVSEIVDVLGQSQPRVSRHLKLMVEAGLLERAREGQWAYFRLARASGHAATLARDLAARLPMDDGVLAADQARLDDLKRRRENRAVAYFRRNAERWDQLRALHVADGEIEAALLAHLPGRGETLLDIGTGTGRILEIMAPRFDRVIGIDQSREMLAVARANLARSGLANAEIRRGDMYALPLPAAAVDVVTIHQVLHYAEDPAAVLREAARVLAPGGVALVVDFAPHDLVELRREHAHVHLGFADNQVEGWLTAAGFAVEPPTRLPGQRLMVGVWRARRLPAAPAITNAARTSAGDPAAARSSAP
ncbi:MAG: metalloregulator ArsR/SmtB family transcription factor [Rhodospirillales bacterium]|nr:MAG: metalloregulator ArsR/SmtB family transcription factor [Rhodospirillales bacterium]